MSEQYYLDMAGNTAGPFSLDHVRELYLAGSVNDATLYSQPNAVQWLPLKTIAPLLRPIPKEPAKLKPVARSSDYFCTTCGTVGRRVSGPAPGSFAVEVALWIFFCLPGFIYTVWRTFSRKKVCPVCKSATMIPCTSPVARERIILK